VIAVPSLLVLLVGAAFVAGARTVSPEAAVLAVVLLLLPIGAWVAVSSAYFTFAGPAIILDESGPIEGIRVSVALVWRNFWGLTGRFLVWSLLAVLGYVVATFPATMLLVGATVSGSDPLPVQIARVLWTSVATAILLPFWVSAVLALYRGLVPSTAAGDGGAAEGGVAGRAETTAAGAPAARAPAPPSPASPDAPNPEGRPQLFE
jgi:hypothetical protein